jgi:hypothetical protein
MASPVPVPAPSAPASEEKVFTLEQLKEHGTRESLWMLLHDKVYDITKFMDEVSSNAEVIGATGARTPSRSVGRRGWGQEAGRSGEV